LLNGKQHDIIKQYSQAIDKINASLGEDIALYTNDVLSKNPHAGGGFSKLLNDQLIPAISYAKLAFNLGRYFFKSISFVVLWICKKAVFSLVKSNKFQCKSLHIVDIFALSQNIVTLEKFDDRYLQYLVKSLSDNGNNYAYLLCFYKDGYNPYKWYRLYKILKSSEYNFITEFDLLSLSDVFRMFVFFVRYPAALVRLISNYNPKSATEVAIKYSLKISLGDYTLPAFVRYLAGIKIATKYPDSKLLSYCEFQVIDKALYKGIKDNSNIKIYAYQQFIKCPTFMNTYISEQEVSGVAPDKIIVTGKHYVPSCSKYNYASLSIRFNNIFNIESSQSLNEILVLLPYSPDEAIYILRLISNPYFSRKNLIIKPHPTLDGRVYKDLIQSHWKVVDGDLYKFFESAKIVITSSSGTAIEAVSVGVSVILVGLPSNVPIDPMIELGKGIIWNEVTEKDLNSVYKQMNYQRTKNIEKINILANRYMSLFFSKPSRKKILDSFDAY